MIKRRTKLAGVSRPDWKNKSRWVLAFEVEDLTQEQIEAIEKKDLDIEIKQHREKRSLNANDYMWLLTEMIAQEKMAQLHIRTSKDDEHWRMMSLYAPAWLNEDGEPTVVWLDPDKDIRSIPGTYFRFYDLDGDKVGWLLLVESRFFDTRQMATFLDRVIEEAQELGIDTRTPDEIERMKQQWGV